MLPLTILGIAGIGVTAILALTKGSDLTSRLETSEAQLEADKLSRADVDPAHFVFNGNAVQLNPTGVGNLMDGKMMVWRSGELNFPTADVINTYNHDLGGVPDFWIVKLRVMSPWQGWATGDEFDIHQGQTWSSNAGDACVGVSATQFKFRHGGSTHNAIWVTSLALGRYFLAAPTDPLKLVITAFRYV